MSPTVDWPGLTISLVSVPTNVTFAPNAVWTYDAVANQTQIFHSTVTFNTEGDYQIAAEVFTVGGPVLEHEVRVVIDSNGAVVNPAINPNPTSDIFIPTTPQPEP
jgi:hypothetical protein